jgi:hypothetical protein
VVQKWSTENPTSESLVAIGQGIGVNTPCFLYILPIFCVNENLQNLSHYCGNVAVLHLDESNALHFTAEFKNFILNIHTW